MKNSLVFVFGLALVTGAIIPFSSASRDAYHAYITNQSNEDQYRRFSERQRYSESKSESITVISTKQSSGIPARYQRNSRINYSDLVDAKRTSTGNSNNYIEATSRTETDFQIRPFSIRGGIAPWKKTLQKTGVSSQMVNLGRTPEILTFETYENESFSLELPIGAIVKTSDAHDFLVGDLDIRIKRFEDGTCSNSYGFMGCATNISRSENTALLGGKGRLIPMERVLRQSYRSDTVLGTVNLQTEVYTEEFTAEFTDGAQYTFYRYAVQDIDGGVYYLEVKVPRREAAKYILAVGKMFDSFRVYPPQ